MQINIDELRQATDKLFNHLRDCDVKYVELKDDFYWYIQRELLYDMNREPRDFTVGQISDDWNDVRRLLEAGNDPVAYGFVDLAPIMRAIGESVPC